MATKERKEEKFQERDDQHAWLNEFTGVIVWHAKLYEHTEQISGTVEPLYNEVLGTMEITFLYQVSRYIRVKNKEI